MKYPDACSKMESPYDNQYAFYADSEIVFGRILAQLSDSFNAYMVNNGIPH